ncbi:L-2-amino-thiazoline-4-carboxylic acid hydrolase [Candidatus Borrarchaeum sp.]|uniref:L-2-amino-thiazoline-4-carboxylic acid hydrolase n=1 Tax=Candidatus Borrarchaeum sp. TaxID=2846742 RepID=UPI0025810DF6|nr:L-2-amino-thiazoline-4-carboxylic acid hydrolase [Candidatus Borrarchaeum sp.]
MAEEILKKIPAEKQWAIASKTFTTTATAMSMMYGDVVGPEKNKEILIALWGGGGKSSYPRMKEAFNIPVDDAIGVATLGSVTSKVSMGPELESELVEAAPERAVVRVTKCPWWERYKEFGITEGAICDASHTANATEGVKAVNPKITFKMTKALPRGDPYCELVYESK